jgi:hypothetical protein
MWSAASVLLFCEYVENDIHDNRVEGKLAKAVIQEWRLRWQLTDLIASPVHFSDWLARYGSSDHDFNESSEYSIL